MVIFCWLAIVKEFCIIRILFKMNLNISRIKEILFRMMMMMILILWVDNIIVKNEDVKDGSLKYLKQLFSNSLIAYILF